MTVNWQVLDRALENIASEPSRWNQSSWVDYLKDKGELCGTTMCLAGWVVADDERYVIANQENEYDNEPMPWFFDRVNGEWVEDVAKIAADLLGIDSWLAVELFSADNGWKTQHNPDTFRTFVYRKIAEYQTQQVEVLQTTLANVRAQYEEPPF